MLFLASLKGLFGDTFSRLLLAANPRKHVRFAGFGGSVFQLSAKIKLCP